MVSAEDCHSKGRRFETARRLFYCRKRTSSKLKRSKSRKVAERARHHMKKGRSSGIGGIGKDGPFRKWKELQASRKDEKVRFESD